MRHEIPVERLGPQAPAMAEAVESCVHCGFCLPTCPTYLTLGEEMDSPRGRIVLMKGALEGDLELQDVLPHIDRCLGCLACVSACPSGVRYGELLTPFRAWSEPRRPPRRPGARFARAMAARTLPFPRRFQAAARLGRYARPLRRVLPRAVQEMVDLIPERLPRSASLRPTTPAIGPRRARVALLEGCAQRVLAPEINAATVRVLSRNGVEVVVPPGQGCCGALAMHTGEAGRARSLARANLRAFDLSDVDAIVTTAAGCGSGMHEYPLLFAGTEHEGLATRVAAHTVDVSTLLDRLGLAELPPAPARDVAVAYHDACHLAHAQGIRAEPRRLLASVPGVRVVELSEPEICCGSAGTYNIEQPEIAGALGRRKATAVSSTGADLVATGNIGCLTQIATHLASLARTTPVLHTMQVLDLAYRQALPLAGAGPHEVLVQGAEGS